MHKNKLLVLDISVVDINIDALDTCVFPCFDGSNTSLQNFMNFFYFIVFLGKRNKTYFILKGFLYKNKSLLLDISVLDINIELSTLVFTLVLTGVTSNCKIL